MNTDVSDAAETIWAYLHGELSDEGRLSFEKEMALDPSLRSRCEEARQLNLLLASALPSLEPYDVAIDALADQALAAWESEQAAASTPVSGPSRALPSPSRWAWVFRRPAMGVTGLAAAAALVLAVTPVLRTPRGVSWSEPVFAPLALRGPGAQPQPGRHGMAAGSAKRCQEALVAAVARTAAARGVALPAGLVFSLRMQELREGAFSVFVQARLRDGRAAGEWSGDYSGLETFLSQADASAARMVETLASFSGFEGGGRRP